MKDEELQRIALSMIGTCDSVEQVIARMDLEINTEELEEALSNANVEQCELCNWWFDAGDLLDDNSEVVGCEDCRPRSEE